MVDWAYNTKLLTGFQLSESGADLIALENMYGLIAKADTFLLLLTIWIQTQLWSTSYRFFFFNLLESEEDLYRLQACMLNSKEGFVLIETCLLNLQESQEDLVPG